MRRTHIANHDPKTHHHLHNLTTSQDNANTHLDNIHKVLHQNGDGTGTKPGTMLDGIDSSCNTIEENSTLMSSRLSNVQDWIGTSGGDGTGVKTGVNIASILVDTDECVSKLTDISTNASLTSSRLSNVQDWIGTAGGEGSGVKTGVNIASLAGCVSGNELQVDIVSGSVSISGGATEAKQDTMETSLNAIETLLTTQATHNGNLLTKNTEIDTAVDEVVDNTSYLDPTANKKSATAIYTTATTITDTNFINSGTAIDTQGYNAIRFYGEATSNNAFHCQVSDDNTNFFPSMTLTIYPSQVQGSTLYYFDTLYNSPPRYIRLKNDSGGSITLNHLRYTLFP